VPEQRVGTVLLGADAEALLEAANEVIDREAGFSRDVADLNLLVQLAVQPDARALPLVDLARRAILADDRIGQQGEHLPDRGCYAGFVRGPRLAELQAVCVEDLAHGVEI